MRTNRKVSITLHETEWLAVIRACWMVAALGSVTGLTFDPELPAHDGRTFGGTVDTAASVIRARLNRAADRAARARGKS